MFEVVVLAEQRVVPGLEVEDLAGRELLRAHRAGEAAQVVDLLPRLPHVVLRNDPLAATRALWSVTPEEKRLHIYIRIWLINLDNSEPRNSSS